LTEGAFNTRSTRQAQVDLNPIQVLTIDDQRLFQDALELALSGRRDLQIFSQGPGTEETLDALIRVNPDVVLLAGNLDRGEHITLKMIRSNVPRARIIVLTDSHDMSELAHYLQDGAIGYIERETSAEGMAAAIHAVHHGEITISQVFLRVILREFIERQTTRERGVSRKTSRLTGVDKHLLRMLTAGATDAQMAEELGVPEQDVLIGVQMILRKLRVRTRAEAVAFVLRNGIPTKGQ
jgi:DNA-binding NarL/FixJ family response regulator